ncbi:MAG: hypothetical protein CVV27_01160 [Candidatus Melainabacteria bacterium HGW-Melainabacteria-1]|nr:MAG: hypothetical protein CVV27_01160 [Candidatus Melainabacteria bacterium HGW-Melainabacteria-1]
MIGLQLSRFGFGACLWLGFMWPACAMPAPAELYRQLTPMVAPLLNDAEIDAPGLQVGIVAPGFSGGFGWGSVSHLTARPPQPDDLYEIASLTKPFVATLALQALSAQGIKPQDPVTPCPEGATTALCYQGQAVTWLDLITHHAALPALPANLDPHSWQPTREYRQEQLQDFLAAFRLTATPGRHFGYSSLGYGILGQRLANLQQMPLAQQLQQLSEDLGLADTLVYLSPEQRQRLLTGYIRRQPVPPANQGDGLIASGGLKASLADLLLWLQHQLGTLPSDWQPAIRHSQQLSGRNGAPFCQMALGWQYFWPAGWYWHSGSAPGFKSFMAFDPQKGTAVVILANAQVTGFKMEPAGMRIMAWLKGVID